MNRNQKPAKDVSRWNLSVIRLISGRTNPHQEKLKWKSLASKTTLETADTRGKVVRKWHVHQTCASHNQAQTLPLFTEERLTFMEHAKRPGECTCFRLSSLFHITSPSSTGASLLVSPASPSEALRRSSSYLQKHIITPRVSSYRCYYSIVCPLEAPTHK